MKASIKGPQKISGEMKAPGSKAYTHRALVASLLTHGETTIQGALDCDDTRRTLEGIKELGASVTVDEGSIISHGPEKLARSKKRINCGESGATLRFLTAVAAASRWTTTLTGTSGLARRPLGPLFTALNELGATAEVTGNQPELELRVRGPLKGGEVSIPGDVSSQFLSGLLFAAPLARSDVAIRVLGTMESRAYVDMTLEVMRRHGIEVESKDDHLRVPAGQQYKPTSHQVAGDFSSACFLMAAAASAGESITILGLGGHSVEPDRAILEIAPRMGLEAHRKGEAIIAERSKLRSFQFDASNNPDLVPVLVVLACAADGPSEISGVKRLQYKETNRLLTLPAELTKMGAKIQVNDDSIRIEPAPLTGAMLDSHQDHRVAMACSSAALSASGESVIENAEAVSKSYPDFFNDLTTLGAKIHVE